MTSIRTATPHRPWQLGITRAAPTDVRHDGLAELSPFDRDREESRRYRRWTFSPADWRKHRSADRYTKNIFNIPASRIAASVVPPVIWVAGVSATVGCYETALLDGILPSFLPTLTVPDPDITGLASFALSLLLAYRTTSSYHRWEEARELWGTLLNRSRDLLRQFLIFAPDAEDTERVAKWITALSYSLMWTLRTEHHLTDLLSTDLTASEMHILMESPHKPMFCLQMLSRLLARSNIDEVEQLQLQNNLTIFEDIIGSCERIYTTPIPLSYTRHTTRFLLIWLTWLPFAFWQTCNWGVVVIIPLIAALLVGIEEIGVQIEEPFGILPLEALCAKLRTNISDIIAIDRGCLKLLK